MRDVIIKMLIILLPFLAIGFMVSFVGNLIQVGWQPTLKPLEPKLSKFNPISGFKRIFSKQSIVNLIFAIAKIFLICYIAYTNIKDQANNLFILYDINLNQALSLIFKVIIDIGLKISIVYIVLGIVDYAYQRWKFRDDMKMTKQEVKDEYKNTEGDPQIKSQQRRRMTESSQRLGMRRTMPFHAKRAKLESSVFKEVLPGEAVMDRRIGWRHPGMRPRRHRGCHGDAVEARRTGMNRCRRHGRRAPLSEADAPSSSR